jgi:hypothetical protein
MLKSCEIDFEEDKMSREMVAVFQFQPEEVSELG